MARPFVVKLAQPGIDVKTASDENLIYNSNWPLLKIYKTGTFITTDDTTTYQVLTEHNLGYIPAFCVFTNNSIQDWWNPTGIPQRRSEYFGFQPLQPLMTSSSLTSGLTDVIFHGTERYKYYIWALDITKPYLAPTIKVGQQATGHGSRTVFKLAKEGKDMSSSNLEDYIIHSDARSPLVHAVFPGVTDTDPTLTSGYGVTFYHNLGYVPMFFIYQSIFNTDGSSPELFINPPMSYFQIFPGQGGSSGVRVDENKLQFFSATRGQNISFLVLKDPFNINYSVRVTI